MSAMTAIALPPLRGDLARHRVRLGLVEARIDDDGGAVLGQRQRDGAPDIASGAGHEGDAAGEGLVVMIWLAPRTRFSMSLRGAEGDEAIPMARHIRIRDCFGMLRLPRNDGK